MNYLIKPHNEALLLLSHLTNEETESQSSNLPRAMQLQVMEPGFEQFHLNPKLLFEITKIHSFSMGE